MRKNPFHDLITALAIVMLSTVTGFMQTNQNSVAVQVDRASTSRAALEAAILKELREVNHARESRPARYSGGYVYTLGRE